MKVLGIGGLVHDASSTLVVDGEIIAAAEEERFTRRKHLGFKDGRFDYPKHSAEYCLAEADLSWEDLDGVAYYFAPIREVLWRLKFRFPKLLHNAKATAWHSLNSIDNCRWHFKARDTIRRLGGSDLDFEFVRHHRSHAASSYYCSGFDDAVTIVVDAIGEGDSTSIFRCHQEEIERIDSVNFPSSLGFIYSLVTEYLGFLPQNDEYKVMGLAAYGEPRFEELFRQIIGPGRRNLYRFDLSWFDPDLSGPDYFATAFKEAVGGGREPTQELEQRHADIASSLQKVVEEAVLAVVREGRSRVKCNNLCLAGGVALNSVMNGRLRRESGFDSIYIQPAANDAGCSLGAALDKYNRDSVSVYHSSELHDIYLGPGYEGDEIGQVLNQVGCGYQKHDDVASYAARKIADGDVVAWFQGRMEWGPRALGHRSILADPRREEMKKRVNAIVKHREGFRPFAPSILAEQWDDYFVSRPDSFMLSVVEVRENKRETIPAVCHVDGTARPQLVSRSQGPLYWRLIKGFEEITGVPLVLNTSFNVKGEPIVLSPRDAVRCFFSTGIQYLVLGDYVLEKESY